MLLSLLCVVGCASNSDDGGIGGTVLHSPDGRTALRLQRAKPQLALGYSITRDGATVIEPSLFSFVVDGVTLTDDADYVDRQTYRDEQRFQTRGVHAQAVAR